jgi:hypothetical protein
MSLLGVAVRGDKPSESGRCSCIHSCTDSVIHKRRQGVMQVAASKCLKVKYEVFLYSSVSIEVSPAKGSLLPGTQPVVRE